jgi:hypothetical protein
VLPFSVSVVKPDEEQAPTDAAAAGAETDETAPEAEETSE